MISLGRLIYIFITCNFIVFGTSKVVEYEGLFNSTLEAEISARLRHVCLQLSNALFYDRQFVKDIIWTGVYYWGDIMQYKCFNVKFIVPSAQVLQDTYFEMHDQLESPPMDWNVAELHMIFKDKYNTNEMILYTNPEKRRGQFDAVPRYKFQPVDGTPESAHTPTVDLRLQVLHTSSDRCKRVQFLFLLMCDVGVVLMTNVQGECPDMALIQEVTRSFSMPRGHWTCIDFVHEKKLDFTLLPEHYT
ncbi:uncharacterized protein LOC105385075 [Plutella xylostella]|uniref:uncharacterized protein LOC105385075 n=1 Tax=Plutella xylostella TaxID=51655 RepID=UPI00203230F6|nr:uncharacterized protein LOC105385075 [Plutella xylostella]